MMDLHEDIDIMYRVVMALTERLGGSVFLTADELLVADCEVLSDITEKGVELIVKHDPRAPKLEGVV